MTFAAPAYLLALLIVPLAIGAYLLAQRRRTRYAVRFTNVDLLANLAPRVPGWRRHVPPAIYVAAIAALGLALARPFMAVPVPRDEATVILAMDVSGSMSATDVAPTRLDAAKKAASDFVSQLPPRFQVGLVTFSSEARIALAPTTDRQALLNAIANLKAGGGTALGDAIGLSLQAAELSAKPSAAAAPTPTNASPAPSAATPAPSGTTPPSGDGSPPLVATVLLSDGANSTGTLEPLEGANLAAAKGVPIYTIALGTAGGVVDVPDRAGVLRRVSVPPDKETLAAVAEATGGRFFEAPTAKDLAAVYDSLGSKVGFTLEQQEITQWFAAGALLLVLAGGGLAVLWFNRFP